MTYTWKTPRGAEIVLDIDVERIYEKTVWADGHEIKVPCSEWRYCVNALTVNGKKTGIADLEMYRGERCIYIGSKGATRLYVAFPDSIKKSIFAEEDDYKKEKLEREAAACAAYESHVASVRKMMDQ